MRAQTLFNPLRRRLTVLLVMLAAVSGLLLPGAGPASADTPRRQTSWTWMHVESFGNPQNGQAYESLIHSIRDAAGHHLDDGVWVTQNEPEALISVRLYNGPTSLRLWIDPQTLTLRGFTNQYTTYRTNDTDYNLHQHLSTYGTHISNDENTGFTYDERLHGVLPFDSTYPSINGVADRDRASMPVSAGQLWDHFHQLAYARDVWAPGGREATAMSFQFFTQFLTEAVRFDDIYWYMRAAMTDSRWWRQGMGANQIALANNWGRISTWARNARTAVTSPAPLYIAGLATLYNWRDVIPVLNVAKHR
ncbi:ribosome-inactivating family protein [Streptomyces sp. NPDC060322]|uniref:ribosome-inactivating family protein n=1 Tax=Streptomyces sp. NPDC060322 TaxID=3347097 RepID=UPI003664318C